MPVRKYYIGLRYDGDLGKIKFIENIKKTILKTYEPVVEIYLNSYFVNIYSKDLKNILTHENCNVPFFFVPLINRDRDGFIHTISCSSKYFTNVFFKEDSSKTKFELKKEYIGYTGKTKEELKYGREIPCKIYLNDSNDYLTKYIYLTEIDILSIQEYGLRESYFIKENTSKQILLELNSLVTEINAFKLIKIDVNFFDSNNLTENMKLEKKWLNFERELKSITRYEVNANKKLVPSTFAVSVYKKSYPSHRLESRLLVQMPIK